MSNKLKKENKKLRKKVNLLATILAKIVSPVFSNQTSTIKGLKFKYTYG